MQPTGCLTIGNYVSVVQDIIFFQKKFLFILCIANLHSLTSNIRIVYTNLYILLNLSIYVSSNISIVKTIIFKQSDLSKHIELSWIIGCKISTKKLNQMIQFKEKSKVGDNLALYSYPVLMISDMMLYLPDFVTVGKDQKQHIELSQYITKSISLTTNKCIPYINTNFNSIMSLRNTRKKMSKSDKSNLSKIAMIDNYSDIIKKISLSKVIDSHEVKKKSGIINLTNLYLSFMKKKIDKYRFFVNHTYLKFKKKIIRRILKNNIIVNIRSSLFCKDYIFLKEILIIGKIRIGRTS